MDHYIPKRRIPVTLWMGEVRGVAGQLFLDLDAEGGHHPTLLDMLNLTSPFLPVLIGDEGRIHLFRRQHVTRVTPGRQVIASDVYSRGFQDWREEPAQVVLVDGTRLAGRVWMPLERPSERLSDFLNRLGHRFFVLLAATGLQLVNASAVSEVELDEGAGAPLATLSEHDTAA